MGFLALSSDLHNTLIILSILMFITFIAFWLLNEFRDTYIHYNVARTLVTQSENDSNNIDNTGNNTQRQNVLLLSSFELSGLRNILSGIHSSIPMHPRQIRRILRQALDSNIVKKVPLSKPDLHITPNFIRTLDGYKFDFQHSIRNNINLINSNIQTPNNQNEITTDKDDTKNNNDNLPDYNDTKEDNNNDNNNDNNKNDIGNEDTHPLDFGNAFTDSDTDDDDKTNKTRKKSEKRLKNGKKKKKQKLSTKKEIEDEISKEGILCMDFYFGVPFIYLTELISLIDYTTQSNKGKILSSKQLRKVHKQSISKRVLNLSSKMNFQRVISQSVSRRASTIDNNKDNDNIDNLENSNNNIQRKDNNNNLNSAIELGNVAPTHRVDKSGDSLEETNNGSPQSISPQLTVTTTNNAIIPEKSPTPSIGFNTDIDIDSENEIENENELISNIDTVSKKKSRKKQKKKKYDISMDRLKPFSCFHKQSLQMRFDDNVTFDHDELEATINAIIGAAIQSSSQNGPTTPGASGIGTTSSPKSTSTEIPITTQKLKTNKLSKSSKSSLMKRKSSKNVLETTDESYYFCVVFSYIQYHRTKENGNLNDNQNKILNGNNNDNINTFNNDINNESKRNDSNNDENYEITHLEISLFDPPSAFTQDTTVAGSRGATIAANTATNIRNRGKGHISRNAVSSMNPQLSMQILVDFKLQKMTQYMDIFGLNSFRSKLEDDNDDTDCKICFSAPRSVVLLPCRHCCVCQNCFKQIHKCPMCRKPIRNSLRWQIN